MEYIEGQRFGTSAIWKITKQIDFNQHLSDLIDRNNTLDQDDDDDDDDTDMNGEMQIDLIINNNQRHIHFR